MKQTKEKAGVTISDLSRKHDCDRSTVRRHLQAVGLRPLAQDGDTKYYDPTLADETLSVALSSGKKAVSKELREAKLKQEIRKLEMANDEKAKKLISRSEFENEIREMSSEVQKNLYALPPRAPELAGLSVPDIEARITAWIDEAVLNLADAAVQMAPDVCPLCQQPKHAGPSKV